jgi:hypoxanthine-DNA glycosylase
MTSRRRATIPRSVGFPPIANLNALVLVLGSMPSVASLAKREYYGHPRNAFWPIMGQLFGAGPELPYTERTQIVRAQRVAIWDVLAECRRAGSLDSAIVAPSETANDFVDFLNQHRQIHAVFFNGGKAESAFRQHALADVEELKRPISYQRLPSTSPAHAGRRFDEKLAAWRAILVALNLSR